MSVVKIEISGVKIEISVFVINNISMCCRDICISLINRGCGGRDRMVVGFMTTYAISK
jgi:hypothetical protein